MKRVLQVLICISFILGSLLLCGAHGESAPPQESYKYTKRSKYFVEPAAADGWVEKTALTTSTSDGKFFCFTSDKAAANDFISTQHTLISYLRSFGLALDNMEYYGTDYGYSFSESSANEAYVALSDMRSWQQVLVTLQTAWGDYVDYGYVYALSNAIAAELGWTTDSIPAYDQDTMDAFFIGNPDAINLLYPTFSTQFASAETVSNSKALAAQLFAQLDWQQALTLPAQEQLERYHALADAYAAKLSVAYTRQKCGYAYYGENVKLRILTTYAELIIAADYHDISESLYGDYWSSYSSIYETANTINDEITAAVASFGLEEKAGVIQIRWLNSEDILAKRFITGSMGTYWPSSHIAYITSIRPYLHEYYHHIEYLLNPALGQVWQSQAFCELGSSRSKYVRQSTEHTFSGTQKGAEAFHAYTGRSYTPGRSDFFEAWDILCHLNDAYQLAYMSTANSLNSFSNYLISLYGEQEVYELLLFPDTIEETTGKSWEQLAAEWEAHIREKYAHVSYTITE